DRTKSLLERLVIDPIFLYTVMIALVPLSFGFTYLMIKLAKNAEANAKKQPKKQENSINLPQNWIYYVFIALIAFQIYLNIAAYYALLNGMKNISLFYIGIIMLVFAGMFHIYRHGRSVANNPPPPYIQARAKLSMKQKAITDKTLSDTKELSSNNANNVKSRSLLSKVFKVNKKDKNSFEKMWNKD
ncbi:MAG: hypothetical protein R3321_07415, partial [Nitrososphaeraceae archaeon]|nr:hypothetical protein [Nitrososphaeraceae archaeon]